MSGHKWFEDLQAVPGPVRLLNSGHEGCLLEGTDPVILASLLEALSILGRLYVVQR